MQVATVGSALLGLVLIVAGLVSFALVRDRGDLVRGSMKWWSVAAPVSAGICLIVVGVAESWLFLF